MGDTAGERRRPTATSTFGVSRRENHDASDFYARFEAPLLSDDAAVDPQKAIDALFAHDARAMPEVEDGSVALVVTSPPYFAGKEYEAALGEGEVPATYLDYLTMLREVFAECVRTLEPGGRIAVNVANLGRRPYRSLAADVVRILQDDLHLLLRGEIVWQKARGSAGSCAWGSFQRPSNPVLRDLTERIVVASKGRFDRAQTARARERAGLPHEASLSRDEFMEATTDVWEIPSASARRVGHPAPFPVELPARLIHLYTYVGDLVLDPFIGSGTTALAALQTGRHYVGYDTDEAYIERARARLRASQRRGDAPAAPRPAEESDAARAIREGRAAKDVGFEALAEAGFTAIEPGVPLPGGVTVAFRADDDGGRAWLFDVAGGFTSTRPGLRRAETLWRTLAKAAVLYELDEKTPFVVLTAGVPAGGSEGAHALRLVTGPGKPIIAVVDLTDGADVARLVGFARGGPPPAP
ncbi:MAG TPA: site-specific DNA-methyltransferase [Acidimicrobiia bacterium]